MENKLSSLGWRIDLTKVNGGAECFGCGHIIRENEIIPTGTLKKIIGMNSNGLIEHLLLLGHFDCLREIYEHKNIIEMYYCNQHETIHSAIVFDLEHRECNIGIEYRYTDLGAVKIICHKHYKKSVVWKEDEEDGR